MSLFDTSNLRDLVESFDDALYGLLTETKAQMIKFLEIETYVKSRHNPIFSTRNQRRCCEEPVVEFADECIGKEEQHASTQF